MKTRYFTGNDLDFNKLIPEPESKEEYPSDYYVKDNSHCAPNPEKDWFDWYEWRSHNWDTSYNGYDTKIKDIEGGLVLISFDTAWTTPWAIISKISSILSDAQIEFRSYETEQANEPCVKTLWKNGKMLSAATSMYDWDKEEFIDFCSTGVHPKYA